MGQPRTAEVKQVAPAIPDLANKYLTNSGEEVRQLEEKTGNNIDAASNK